MPDITYTNATSLFPNKNATTDSNSNSNSKPKKISIREFCESKEQMFIKIKSEEECLKLFQAFYSYGLRWNSDDSYITQDGRIKRNYGVNNIYSNKGSYGGSHHEICDNEIVLDGYRHYYAFYFDEVDFENKKNYLSGGWVLTQNEYNILQKINPQTTMFQNNLLTHYRKNQNGFRGISTLAFKNIPIGNILNNCVIDNGGDV